MVSSTVPRLEEKCPPVADTDSTMNSRNSAASACRSRRSSLRRSAGSLMVSSNGNFEVLILGVPSFKGASVQIAGSMFAFDDKFGQLPQTVGPDVERLQGIERVGQQIVRKLLGRTEAQDRKSTRLNSSHTVISYAVFCLKKKNNGWSGELVLETCTT